MSVILDALRITRGGEKGRGKSPEEIALEEDLRATRESTRQAQQDVARAMEALARSEGRESALVTPSAPEPVAASPEKKKKEKKSMPKNPKEEIDAFVAEFDLANEHALLPADFNTLEEPQKLKVIRDLKRRIVDIVKSDAQTQYSEELKERTRKDGKLRALGAVMDSIKKEAEIKTFEKEAFEKIRNTPEGQRLIAEDLGMLIEKTKNQDIVIHPKSGNPYVFYINRSDYEDYSSSEGEAFTYFSWKANDFANMPYEWGQEKRGKHRKAYDKAKTEYENAREVILRIKVGREEHPREKGKALLEVLETDNAIQMEQLLNTHPEFEKALDEMGKNPDFVESVKDSGKAAGSILNTLTGKNFTNRLLIGSGVSLRWAARGAALATGVTGITLAAAPTIGGVIGGIRGRIRGQETLQERQKGARHGQKDENREAKNTTRADNLSKRIEDVMTKLNTVKTVEEETKLLDQLKRRIGYTQDKIEQGLVDFGNAKSSLNNQFNLINNLNNAMVVSASLEQTTRKDIDERLNRFLSYKIGKIEEAQKAFIKKQMWKGARWGAVGATGGYALRYAGEYMGWWGDRGSEAGQADTTEEGFVKRAENWINNIFGRNELETSSASDVVPPESAPSTPTETPVTESPISPSTPESVEGAQTVPIETPAGEPPISPSTPEPVGGQIVTPEPGASAQTHAIHRSWYDNDTKNFDKNELRTHWGGEKGTGINAEGKYVLDVGRMTPDGSSHAGMSANAQELLKEGKLKLLISASRETQNQVYEVPINADGQIVIDPNSDIGKMFFANVNGRAQFTGRFGEIGEDRGNNNFRILSTIEGGERGTVVNNIPETTPEPAPEVQPDQNVVEKNVDNIPPEPVTTPGPEAVPEPTPRATPEPSSGQGVTVEDARSNVMQHFERAGQHSAEEIPGAYQAYTPPEHDEYGNLLIYNKDGTHMIGRVPPRWNTVQHIPGTEASRPYTPPRNVPYAPSIFERPRVFFPGISEQENLILQTHPEFAENHFHLTGEQLMRVYETHQTNIDRIFPGNLMEDWQDWKNLSPKKMLGNPDFENDPEYKPLMDYLHKIAEITKPKGGLLRKNETVEEYIARALQKAAKEGKLNEMKMPVME